LRAGAQVYQVFIKASPEQIWEATMKPEFTQEYSYGCVDSTFQPGSPYLGWSEDRCEQFVEGEVLEAGPAAAPQPHLADTLGHRSGSRAKGMSVAMMVVIRRFCVSAFGELRRLVLRGEIVRIRFR
jgi:hypothetical protein